MLLTTNQHEKIKKLQIIKYIFLFFRGQSCWPKGNIKLSSYLSFDKQYLSNNKNNAIVKVNNENLFHWELDDIIKLFELTLDNLEKIKISLERKEITEISIHNLIISSIDQSYFNIDFEPFLISKYIYSLNFSFDNRRHLALTNEEDENHEIQVSGLLDMYSNDYFLIKYDRKDKHDFVAELYIRINNKTINIEFYSSLHISKITGKNNDIIEHSLKMIDKDYVGKYIFDKISTLIDGNEFEIAMKLFAMANFESNYFEPILVKHNQDSNDNTILQFIDSLRLIDLFKRNLPGDEAILHWPPRVINELNEL